MYYFIINPESGSGRGRTIWRTVQAELKRTGTDYRAFLLSKQGEARSLAGSLSKSSAAPTIVVIGGDGTINEVINGITDFSAVTFACIPTGSGNDFVRGLHLAKEPVMALHQILHPKKILKINVGCVHACPDNRDSAALQQFSYAVSAGIGFDAAVCSLVQASKLKKILNRFRFGKLVYLTTALSQLFTMRRCTLSVSLENGQTITYPNAYFAAAMNLPFEGGGFMFCPRALSADDCIDLFIAHDISRLKVLFLLPLAFAGHHTGFRGVEIIRCRQAEITSDAPLWVHTDGEVPGAFRNVTFALHPEKLPVIAG